MTEQGGYVVEDKGTLRIDESLSEVVDRVRGLSERLMISAGYL